MTPLPQSGLEGIWKLLTVLMSPWLLSTRWPDGCFRLVHCNNGSCGGWSGVGGGQHQQTLFVVHASDPLELQHVATNIEMFSFQLKPFLVPLLPLTDSVDVFTKHCERSHPSSVFLILYFQSLKTQTFSWLNVVPTVRAKYRMTKIIKVKSIDISLCLNNHKINNFLLQNTNKPTVSPFLKGVIARDIFFL